MHSRKYLQLSIVVALLSAFISSKAETYVFLNMGVNGYGTNINHTYTGTASLSMNNQIQEGNAAVGGGLGIGHRLSFAPYYIAIEAGTATKPGQVDQNQTAVQATYTNSGSTYLHKTAVVEQTFNNPLIAVAKIGYYISKRLSTYIGAGIEGAKYELTYNHNTGQYADASINNSDGMTITYSDTQGLARVVLGAEYCITPHYSWYMELSFSGKNDTTVSGTSTTDTLTFKRAQSTGHVGFIYFV